MFLNVMCKLREIGFWSLDSVKGGHVRKTYEQLKKFDALDSCSPELLTHQKSALRELLRHAANTTEFYKKNAEGNSLEQFPVINKNIIRAQQNKFISELFNKTKLVSMFTSGSTGTPFVCYQNIEKKKRVYAEVIYYSEKAGYSVGKNLIFLRAITKQSKKSKLLQWIQNKILLDISNLDDKHVEQLLVRIEKASRSGSMMLAYASTYDALKDYFRRKGIGSLGKINLLGIISGSEMLFDDTREALETVFDCKVFSRYSNQENGIIGQDETENNTFILNEAHYMLEILKMDSNEPATEGEVGRIVITDLYNYAMPMIRYDTGDIGSLVLVKRNGVNKKAIKNFGGRRIDMVFDSYGHRLSPHIITNNLWSFPEIREGATKASTMIFICV
jgi:phenylacetate-CoA ligase